MLDCQSCNYHIILFQANKRPSLCKYSPPNFDSFVVFEVLCVTAHHAKFLHRELKVGL